MTHIIMTEDQAQQIADGSLPIVLVDSTGRQLLRINQMDPEPAPPSNLSPEGWAEIVRQSQNPGTYSTLREIKERHGWTDSK
jgi:hypothetical protein